MKRYIFLLICFLTGCSLSEINQVEEIDRLPEIFPDYIGCTIPPNISPLNFKLTEKYDEARVILSCGEERWEIKAGKKQFTFPVSAWKKWIDGAAGKNVEVKILLKQTDKQWIGFRPFEWQVAHEPMDPYLAYRRIEPGYQLWNQMGIYQRHLENFEESPIMENRLTEKNCMNCHSFAMQDPEKMLFHMRGPLGGTYLLKGETIEKLNTQTDQTLSPLVYPSWHPSGRFVAFSVNDTQQAFHMNDPNRVEVYDKESDVVVYDVEKHEIITSPLLTLPDRMETFPTFSPDGKTLYFCSAVEKNYPRQFKEVKYSLCSLSFDPEKQSFGEQVDTLFNALEKEKSVSFPRVSPDGQYIMYTLSDYGTFSIWHKEADLYMIRLDSGEHYPLSNANSEDVESYHSWSSNSRWVVYSSRRIDGLYTRPFFTYIDQAGNAHKPFLLPQEDTDYYDWSMKSYNIPEFIKGPVKNHQKKIREKARKDPGINVTYREGK